MPTVVPGLLLLPDFIPWAPRVEFDLSSDLARAPRLELDLKLMNTILIVIIIYIYILHYTFHHQVSSS